MTEGILKLTIKYFYLSNFYPTFNTSSRWGGRVHTEKFGSSVIEIGANWIHGGCVANPVFNLANRRRKSLLLHDGKVLLKSATEREAAILCEFFRYTG